MTSRWRCGDQIVLREVWRGKVWSGKPVTVVEDTPDLLVLYMAAGTMCKMPVTPNGKLCHLLVGEWELADDRWIGDWLRLVRPGASHSALLLRTQGQSSQPKWYVNMEAPLCRTPLGFDYMDLMLDIVANPDLSEWRWKDEGQFEKARTLGIVSDVKARALRAEGERVIEQMRNREPPFDGGWEQWRPEPEWPIPKLPCGWNVIS